MPSPLWALSGDSLGTSWVLLLCGYSSTPGHRRFYLRLIDPSDRSVPLCALMGFIMAIGTAGMVSALIGAVQTCGS